jgi:thiamine biosynthesis lipoprotein
MIVWDSATRMLGKRAAGVEIELSSIAKGYAVDLAADVLDELGIGNFLLEVGGEMQARGLSPRGDQWRVAIERPEVARSGVARTIALSNTGIATSGDYRNYFEVEGVRYSHLIDPRTGYPIRHDLVSVTVIHPSTGIADAWATALAVMGFESAMALAEARDLPIYVIRRTGDTLAPSWSTAFNQYVPSGT